MSMRRIFFAAYCLAILTLIGASGTAVADDVIARFEGTSTGNAMGHQVMILGVTALSNGKTARIPVPNEDPKKTGAPMPKADLNTVISKLTAGQIIKISVDSTKDYGPALTSIALYDTKPGEDTPNGYVFSKTFDKTVGKNTITTVVLTKFGVEHAFTIAMHKDEKGEQEQDPDVVAAIAKLSPDAAVWVQTLGKNLVAIEPYAEPQTGKVGKIADTDVDGHKVKSAEIETADGKTVTVMVPGKSVGKTFVADSLVLGQLNKVKPGAQVEFRVHEDGDKLWLREIVAVKAGAKKPAEPATAPKK